MTKKILTCFMACILMSGTLAAAGRQQPADRGFRYLGVLAEGYPDGLVRSQLALARVDVYDIQEGMIIFGINEKSKVTPFFNKHLPFLEGVYLDRQSVLGNAHVAKSRIAREFLAFFSGNREPGRRSGFEPELKNRYFIQGGERISRGMLALDKMIAGNSFTAVTLPKGSGDDAYEDNDSLATAAAISTGSYSDLQCLDDDWYKVAVSEGQDLVVTTRYNDDLGNLYLYIYDGEGTLITNSIHFNGSRRTTSANLGAGNYFIYVYGSGDLAYSMDVEAGTLLGVIAGRVTDTSAAPIQSVWVYGYDTDWYSLGSCETSASGDYAMEVFPGQAYVFFEAYSAGNFINEYYNDKSPEVTPDEVTVTAGATTSGIDAELASGGAISGRVTLDPSGAGTSNVNVYLYDLDYGYVKNTYPDSNGYFTLRGLPSGSYKLFFNSYEDYYLSKWYKDKDSFQASDTLIVIAGNELTGINAQLAFGGAISGRVRDPYGNGINSIPVTAYDSSGNFLGNDWTDSNGDYRILRLPAASSKIFFNVSYNGTYIDEWYNDKRTFPEATPVSITAGSDTANINADVIIGGGISGRLTDGSGTGIDNVMVKVFDSDANLQNTYIYTDSNGDYDVQGLAPGSYKVWFDAVYADPYASEWYSDKGSFDTGNTVAVASGSTTTHIDAVLSESGSISGYVQNPLRGGIKGVIVSAYDLDHRLICSTQSDDSGSFSFWALPAGSYKVYFDPAYANGQYIAEWYLDKAGFDAATSVTVNNNTTTSLVATYLSVGTRIAITSPVNGSTWFTKSLQQITWTKIGTQNAYVKIQLYRGTALATTISSKTPNNGVFSWTLPATLTASTGYRVKITTSDGKVAAYSSYFTIARPSITVTAPAAGAVWTRGSARVITWVKTGAQAATVKIQLFKGTMLKSTLATSTANDGSFDWTVPATLGVGTNYKFKVITTDSAVSAISGLFTIN